MFLAFCVLVTFVAPFYIIYKPPSLLMQYFQDQWPDVLFHVSTQEKVVALTIDDAPSWYTSQVLEILKEHNAQATFFVIGGQVNGREEMLGELARSGMELGNHAMHDEASRGLSDEELAAQMHAVDALIGEAYASAGIVRPSARYFRPGSGFFSARMRMLVATLHYRLVLGDIYPHDSQIPYWRVNARHVLSMLKPGGIIICHDRRSWTVPMLKKVVPEIKKKGYRIVTVSRLLQEGRKE